MRIRLRSLLLLCGATFACDRPPTATPVAVAALTLAGPVTPGQSATVHGRKLGGETALLVDGVRVPLVPTSDSTAVFTAPHLRPCDTDGRELPLALASSPAAVVPARLHLATTVTLAPGESRVLSATDGACLQLPAVDADFVVSAVNLEETPSETSRQLADLTAWTAEDPPPADVPGPAFAAHDDQSFRTAPRTRLLTQPPLAWPAPYSASPRLFDPHYASALPGDTVRFVDWSRATSCSQAPGTVPTYAVAVAATSGLTVIGVDLRLAGSADYLTPGGRAFLTTAAAIADPLIVPAMRRLFDGDYRPLPSAGGRHFHIVTAIPAVAYSSDGGTSKPQADCALASEMVATLHAPPALPNALGPRILATEIVHEYAHNADEIPGRRFGHRGGSLGWMQESWAVNAEETAARLATGEPTRAHLSGLDAGKPYRAGTTNSDWGLYPQRSPWVGTGAYKQGAALVAFARETAGEASLGDPAPSLYLRLLARDAWTVSALASEVGTSAAELLDAWALADATDDLSPPEVAAAARLRSWDDAERVAGNEGPRGGSPAEARPSRSVGRTGQRKTVTLSAAPGSYAAAYVFADGSLGATLQVKQSSAGSIRVRLTRTR
jgi:hypothetical protein